MEDNTQTQETKKNNSAKAGIAIVGLIVIIVVAIVAFQAVAGESTTQPQQSNTTEGSMMERTGSEESMMMEGSNYKDGKYTAVGSYITPGGAQEVGVSVTLSDGIIESVEVDELGTLPISKEKQADFAANYKTFVVGKSIDEVELTKVSGSSLTPKGFNDALEQIKDEAGA